MIFGLRAPLRFILSSYACGLLPPFFFICCSFMVFAFIIFLWSSNQNLLVFAMMMPRYCCDDALLLILLLLNTATAFSFVCGYCCMCCWNSFLRFDTCCCSFIPWLFAWRSLWYVCALLLFLVHYFVFSIFLSCCLSWYFRSVVCTILVISVWSGVAGDGWFFLLYLFFFSSFVSFLSSSSSLSSSSFVLVVAAANWLFFFVAVVRFEMVWVDLVSSQSHTNGTTI